MSVLKGTRPLRGTWPLWWLLQLLAELIIRSALSTQPWLIPVSILRSGCSSSCRSWTSTSAPGSAPTSASTARWTATRRAPAVHQLPAGRLAVPIIETLATTHRNFSTSQRVSSAPDLATLTLMLILVGESRRVASAQFLLELYKQPSVSMTDRTSRTSHFVNPPDLAGRIVESRGIGHQRCRSAGGH